ncbi:MAG: tyrosine-type recombinase/integrase [Eubacterium sp.]|nr:tyrosine-type recombinase/integrase [Eubacterium sp.]
MAVDKKITYHEQTSRENTRKLREVLDTLPGFCRDYFRAMEPKTSAKTRISYVYDIRLFFTFLCQANPSFKNKDDIRAISLTDLERLDALDIEEYMEYLKLYDDEAGVTHTNGERGIKRKLASLRSFFNYYYKHEMINKNPTVIVDMPKLHKQEITRLDYDEVANLLDYVEHGGASMTGMKKTYFEKNKVRNLALFTLLLGTGIRVSECVGLDIEDIDFKNNRIKIIRKGGKEDFVYFGDEVSEAMYRYYEERRTIETKAGHEHAFFLSIQKRRITVQAVEDLVKDAAQHVTTVKHITPHKLRSTYGTSLYRETGDIYLVAEVLGHNDVNTTRRHYAALDEDRKRRAASAVTLRKDN